MPRVKSQETQRKNGQHFYYAFCLAWSETCRIKFLAGIKKVSFISETCAKSRQGPDRGRNVGSSK